VQAEVSRAELLFEQAPSVILTRLGGMQLVRQKVREAAAGGGGGFRLQHARRLPATAGWTLAHDHRLLQVRTSCLRHHNQKGLFFFWNSLS